MQKPALKPSLPSVNEDENYLTIYSMLHKDFNDWVQNPVGQPSQVLPMENLDSYIVGNIIVVKNKTDVKYTLNTVEGIEKGYPEFVDNIECPLPQPGDTLNPTTAANIYTDSAYLNEEVFLEPPNTSMTLKEKGNIMYIFNAGGFKPKPADGAKRIIGNYEYSFNQEWDFTNLKWVNMTENQWGVRDLNALGGPLKDSIDGFSIKIPELWK